MKIIELSDLGGIVKDGMAVAGAGFSKAGIADYVYKGLEDSFVNTGHPKDITMIINALGGTGVVGTYNDHFGPEGMVSDVRVSHIQLAPRVRDQIDAGKIQGHMYPLGALAQLYRDMGAGKPGTLSKAGLGTFVDPRQDGGRMNDITKDDICRLVEIDGEEWLFYPAFPIDVAIIKATYADESGNISMEHEPTVSDAFNTVQAAKQQGGISIVQVEKVVKNGELLARNIEVPGIMVDYVVVAPKEYSKQTVEIDYDPVLCQLETQDLSKIEKMPLNIKKLIARRSTMELRKGDKVNLGYGIPEFCGDIAAEEGKSRDFTLTCECVLMGGVPGSGMEFGTTRNADYVTDMAKMMDWYDGGGLDVSVLGFGEIDAAGNVNASRFGMSVGPGGFINITTGTKRNVFCGTFTTGGLKVSAGEGKLSIEQEGKIKKFVNSVEQVTFNADVAFKDGHEIIYVTERAVFELREDEMVLTEIAPGIDLEKDVLSQMDFPVKVADDLKEMDPRIFTDSTMGL